MMYALFPYMSTLAHLPEESVVVVAATVVANNDGNLFGDLVCADSVVQVHDPHALKLWKLVECCVEVGDVCLVVLC